MSKVTPVFVLIVGRLKLHLLWFHYKVINMDLLDVFSIYSSKCSLVIMI